jgi:hypothetical protein
MPDQLPAPPLALMGQLPVPQQEAAMLLLARLIAAAAAATAAAAETGDCDE